MWRLAFHACAHWESWWSVWDVETPSQGGKLGLSPGRPFSAKQTIIYSRPASSVALVETDFCICQSLVSVNIQVMLTRLTVGLCLIRIFLLI